MKRLTHEEFMEKFYKKNKNAESIEILSKYKGSKAKIKCKCKLDGYEWETTPNTLLRGSGCKKCGYKKNGESFKKTTEQFIKELKKINSDIEILGEYKSNGEKIKCRCKIDNKIWYARPRDLLNGHGCPKCGIKSNVEKRSKTHEEFKQKLEKINSDIEILGEYKRSTDKIKVRCKKDGYEWEVVANSLLIGIGCPKCSGKAKKTTEEFKQEMKEIDSNIEILGEYVGNKAKIKVKCKKCNHIWFAKPNNLLNGSGCPKCNASKGEKRVAKYLDNKNIKYVHDKYYFKDLKNSKGNILRPDFIIPNLKIWIEYDGMQHFEVVDFTSKNQKQAEDKFKETQENDKIKNEYAKKYNWKLIRIPYTEYDNIEKILEKELED